MNDVKKKKKFFENAKAKKLVTYCYYFCVLSASYPKNIQHLHKLPTNSKPKLFFKWFIKKHHLCCNATTSWKDKGTHVHGSSFVLFGSHFHFKTFKLNWCHIQVLVIKTIMLQSLDVSLLDWHLIYADLIRSPVFILSLTYLPLGVR